MVPPVSVGAEQSVLGQRRLCTKQAYGHPGSGSGRVETMQRISAGPPPLWLLRFPAELMHSVLWDGALWTGVDPSQAICRGALEPLEVASTHLVSRLKRRSSYT